MLINNIIYSDTSNYSMKIANAEDCYVWDGEGNKYIDLTSGWNVTNLGWNNPEINEAVKAQIDKTTYSHLWNSADTQEEYANKLLDALPEELTHIGRATGGTEANEMAIKTARIYTGRKKVLGFNIAYHGQTLMLLAFGSDKFKDIAPENEYCIGIDFPDKHEKASDGEILDNFRKNLEEYLSGEDVAAVLIEAGIVTGGGGFTATAPKGFMKVVREVTDKYGTLIILDEVGTGFSRCGKLFGMEIEGITPDIATFAKAIANGSGGLSAIVAKAKIAEATHSNSVFISTFGWRLPDCAAALKTLEIHQRDKVWEKSEQDGKYIRQTVREKLKDNPHFSYTKGLGMEIGVTFNDNDYVEKIVSNAREQGLYVVSSGNNIQLMPPLTIERNLLDEGLEKFFNACS